MAWSGPDAYSGCMKGGLARGSGSQLAGPNLTKLSVSGSRIVGAGAQSPGALLHDASNSGRRVEVEVEHCGEVASRAQLELVV